MNVPLETLFASAARLLLASVWSSTVIAIVLLALEPLLRRAPAALRSALLAVALLRFLWPASLGVSWAPDLGAAAIASAVGNAASERAVAWIAAAALVVWALGTLARLAQLGAAHARCAQWREGRAPDPALARRLGELAVRAGLKRAPVVVIRPDVVVPFAIGARRPTLVLPETSMPDAALLHELAHVRRGDLWVRGLAAGVEALWWWHPLVRALASRLHAAQEEACDDFAIVLSGVTPERYGALLVAAARDARGMRSAPAAVTARFDGRSLERRLRRVLGPRRPSHRLSFVHVLLIAAAVALALPRPGGAGLDLRLLPGAPQPHVHLHSHGH